MKKLSLILTLSVSVCLLAACGSVSQSDESTSSKLVKSSQSTTESNHIDILYAVFDDDNVDAYPLEYTGDKKTAEELAYELSGLTGLDFNITVSETDDGLIVDWAADSTLVAGLDGRVQKDDFFFFDQDSLSWFMMDSLWWTLTENLDAENIYYTMDGGFELVLEELYPVHEIPSDTPYMGSEFYFAHADVKGNTPEDYQGFWEYPDGKILEIEGDTWYFYEDDGITMLAWGPMDYDEEAAYLMNEDGSSGGGKIYFDEDNNLIDYGMILTNIN